MLRLESKSLLSARVPLECSEQSNHPGRKRRAEQDVASASSDYSPLVSKKKCRGLDRNQRSTRFWDTLSKVRLSKRALEEFDRRRELRTQRELRGNIRLDREAFIHRNVGQFARRGGPSLVHLRGYSNSNITSHSNTQNRERSAGSGRTNSATPSKSSLYTPNYEQKLIDSGIHPNDYDAEGEGPINQDEILARLTASRASLSPSRFTEQDFKYFRKDTGRAPTEPSTIQRVFSTIEGNSHGHLTAADLIFTCMKPMAEDLARAKPDLYDGVAPGKIDARVRATLQEHILPSKKSHVLAAPNFFTEGKSAGGRADVARLQACHDGSVGARGMQALQNYGEDKPAYDGKAYSFSTTYHGGTGTLQLYAHHLIGPKQPGGNPEYHMTQLNSFAMTGNSKSFREGARAYRNLRDYAKEQRDSLIDQANLRASNMPTSLSSIRITATPSAGAIPFIDESDTLLDKLPQDEVTYKRARSTSQRKDSSKQPVQDRPLGPTSTNKATKTSARTTSRPPTRGE